jgi:hypothetical protein
VEAQYAEWLMSRVGGQEEPGADTKKADENKSPFPRDSVLAHLGRSIDTLKELNAERANNHELSEALSRAITLLSEIKDDYASAVQPDARKLEDSLTGIERMLDDAVRVAIDEGEFEAVTAEIESQMKPYKRHMDKAAFEQTRGNLLRKRLRDYYGVPRLSLFFL